MSPAIRFFRPFVLLLAATALASSFSSCTSRRLAQEQIRSNAKSITQEGWQLVREERFDEARESFMQASQFDRKLPAPNFGIAYTYSAQNNWKKAIPYYERYIAMDPGYSEAYANLGQGLLIKGDMASAKYNLERAIGINPRNAGAYFHMAQYYAAKGLWKRSASYANQAEARGFAVPEDFKGALVQGLANPTRSFNVLPAVSPNRNLTTAQPEGRMIIGAPAEGSAAVPIPAAVGENMPYPPAR